MLGRETISLKDYPDLSFIIIKCHMGLWTMSQFKTRKLKLERAEKIEWPGGKYKSHLQSGTCMLSHFSRVWLAVTLRTVAHQAPLPMGSSSQEYWSGLPSPRDLPDPGILSLGKNCPQPLGFPGGSMVKNLPANVGIERDAVSIPGLRRSSGGGNGNPLQYSCLEKPMDRGAWPPLGLHGVAKSHIWISTAQLCDGK